MARRCCAGLALFNPIVFAFPTWKTVGGLRASPRCEKLTACNTRAFSILAMAAVRGPGHFFVCFRQPRLADGLQASPGGSKDEQEARLGGFHRLRLVRLVHQAGPGSLLETGVSRIREEESHSPRGGLSAAKATDPGRKEPERAARGEVPGSRLSHHCRPGRRGKDWSASWVTRRVDLRLSSPQLEKLPKS